MWLRVPGRNQGALTIGSRPVAFETARPSAEIEKLEQSLAEGRFLGGRGYSARENRHLLRALRNDANDLDAFYGEQFAHLLETDLCLAPGHDIADALGDDHVALRLQLRLDPELGIHLLLNIDAAGAIGIGDGFCGFQRRLEGIERRNIGLRLTSLDRHRDLGFDEINPALRFYDALFNKIAQRIPHHDDEIGIFAACEAGWDRFIGRAH